MVQNTQARKLALTVLVFHVPVKGKGKTSIISEIRVSVGDMPIASMRIPGKASREWAERQLRLSGSPGYQRSQPGWDLARSVGLVR